MKTLFKVLGIVVVVLLAAMIVLPMIFKDEIVTMVEKEANKNLKAELAFDDVGLSMFRSFPDFTLTLEGLTVTGEKAFEGTELANIGEFLVTVDLWSVIAGDAIRIEEIGLSEPRIHVKVLEDGRANYDIVKSTPDTAAEEETSETGGGVRIGLKEYYVEDGVLLYEDDAMGMYMGLSGLDHNGSGDFTASEFELDSETEVDAASFSFGGVTYLSEAEVAIDAIFGMNMAEMIFTFKDNTVSVNDLTLGFDGQIAMPEGSIVTNLDFQTRETDFKTLLSLVPAIYAREFASVETSGKMGLKGHVKGHYNENAYPGFGLDLVVKDARFDYPDLPASVENINVALNVQRDKGPSLDNTVIDLSKFHMDVAENPIDATLNLRTPMSDPDIKCSVKSQLSLEKLSEAIPMEEGEKYQGTITADLDIDGQMSDIEQRRYERFKAKGELHVLDMLYSSPSLPYEVAVNELYFKFSPQALRLTKFDSRIGESDLKASGQVTNYLAYALKDEPLAGNFTVNSDRFDLNELMVEAEQGSVEKEEKKAESEEESSEMGVVAVPENVNFSMNASVGELIWDNISMKNVRGGIDIRNETATLNEFYMELLKGTVTVNGSYSTQRIEKPQVDFSYDIKKMDIKETAETFVTVDKMAPIAKKARGRFSSDMTLDCALNEKMAPIENSIDGSGTVRSEKVRFENLKILEKASKVLKIDNFAEKGIRDINIGFEVHDGKVRVKPYDIKVDGIKATISGTTSFDRSIDYTVDTRIPREKFGSGANKLLDKAESFAQQKGVDASVGDEVPVKLKITGTVEDPKIGTEFTNKGGGKDLKETVKDTVKEKVKEKVDEAKKKAIAKAKKKGDELVREAEKKADRIRSEADKKADRIVKEADKKARKMVDEAGNPIAKKAAKESAKKIKKEARKKADRIRSEADKKADRVVREAKEKRKKLIEEAKKK